MEDIEETPPLEVDPYLVLEIETAASTSEVKTAYRKLALRHHPGVFRNNIIPPFPWVSELGG